MQKLQSKKTQKDLILKRKTPRFEKPSEVERWTKETKVNVLRGSVKVHVNRMSNIRKPDVEQRGPCNEHKDYKTPINRLLNR